MIRLAEMADLDDIMDIVGETNKIMSSQGNYQWDDTYPARTDFELDIKRRTLYLILRDAETAGFMCIDGDVPEPYSGATWTSSGSVLVLHRMALSPKYRGRGLAGALLDFALLRAKENGVDSLRTDTFSGNVQMNSLFLKHGFRKTGEIELPGKRYQPFYCYEKQVEKTEIAGE